LSGNGIFRKNKLLVFHLIKLAEMVIVPLLKGVFRCPLAAKKGCGNMFDLEKKNV
jgi:hypothetical protein